MSSKKKIQYYEWFLFFSHAPPKRLLWDYGKYNFTNKGWLLYCSNKCPVYRLFGHLAETTAAVTLPLWKHYMSLYENELNSFFQQAELFMSHAAEARDKRTAVNYRDSYKMHLSLFPCACVHARALESLQSAQGRESDREMERDL